MKRLTLLLLSFLGMLFTSWGQDAPSIAPSVPPSPQAEAFNRFGDYSVNYSTGVPSISIPLFEINHHGYKLPFSLNYFPSPLKLGYNYDVFGHGWGLSVSSSISRTINFAPDEINDFVIDQPIEDLYPFSYGSSSSNGFDNLYNFNYGHDDFNAVLPDGSSFEFYIEKQNGNYVVAVSNGRPVKITPILSYITLTGFTIVDENGVKYTFGDGDYVLADSSTPIALVGKNVSWQLTRIDLPQSGEPITFSYGKRITNFAGGWEPELSFFGGQYYWDSAYDQDNWNIYGYTRPSLVWSAHKYNMLQLASINYGNTAIAFTYANNSSDPQPYNYVTSIGIQDNVSVKNIGLTFVANISLCTANQNNYPIMELDSVKIKDPQGIVPPQIYKCINYPISYFNGSTDSWGNLTGINPNILGNYQFYTYYPHGAGDFLVESDPPFLSKLKAGDYPRQPGMEHGLLDSLKYPTGGYTHFVWERHMYHPHTDENGVYHSDPNENSPVNASGFRIKAIENYTSSGVLADNKIYEYGKWVDDGSGNFYPSGVGEAVVDPDIFSYMDFQYASDSQVNFKNICQGDLSSLNIENWPDEYRSLLMTWQFTLSANNFRRILNGRPEVLYPEVTEYHGQMYWESWRSDTTAGKTVYKYDIYDQNGVFFDSLQYYGNRLDCAPNINRYDKWKEKDDYKRIGQNYQLIRKEINDWIYSPVPGNSQTQVFSQIKQSHYIDMWSNYGMTNFSPYPCLFQKHLLFTMPELNLKTIFTYNTTGDSLITTEGNTYNSYNQIINKVSLNSYNNYTINNYKHPNDYYFGSVTNIISAMKTKNIISPVMEDSTTVNDNSPLPGKVISGYKTDFNQFAFGSDTIIVPNKDYDLEINPSGNQYVLKNHILSYSRNGNPLEVISKQGVHTCYIWGYDDRYMVASIVNASYNTGGDIVSGGNSFYQSQITSILNDTCSTTYSTLATKLNQIRTTLPASTVTTYTYRPLAGMTSMTDPNGIMTKYEYDGLGRLKTALDNDDKVTGHYKYHNVVGVATTTPATPPPTLNLAPINESFYTSGGTDTIFVRCNASWQVSVSDPWLTVSPSSGTNNGYFLLTCYENLNDARSGSFTVHAGTSGWQKDTTINVPQSGSNYFIQPGSNGVGDYSTPMYYNPALVSFSYTLDPFNLYSNYYVQVQSPAFDPNPVSISIYYCDESGWLDFYYDEGSNSLSFWATNTPLYTQYAMVFVSSDTPSGSVTRCFWVKIGY
jgi:YD repeat-containing protein